MKYITIPFLPEFREAILDGRKTCTSRTRRMGKKGDLFLVAGKPFRLVEVSLANLEFVRDILYRQEGCASPDAFVQVWNRIHPRKRFDPNQFVAVHEFVPAEASWDDGP